MKRFCHFLPLFAAVLLLFSACGTALFPPGSVPEPPLSSENAAPPFSPAQTDASLSTDETKGTGEPLPPETEPARTNEPDPILVKDPDSDHDHIFVFTARLEATCTKEGQEVYTCSCGQTTVKTIAALGHSFSAWESAKANDCETPGEEKRVCTRCGAEEKRSVPAPGHEIVGTVCTRCQKEFPQQLYVLGKGLDFNESKASLLAKFGAPGETLTEGDKETLVYASDYRRFTLLQIDDLGLWGVYTLDPAAFCRVDGVNVKCALFAGKMQADSFRESVSGKVRTTAFCDSASGNANWAIWFTLSEVSYHYAVDGAIFQNFYAQEKICYYLTNALRVKHGLSPLIYSPQATAVARDYAKELTGREHFDHDDSYKARLTEQGVAWFWIGENLSQGYENVFQVVNAYYNSPSHRENLLSPHFTHLGTGFALSTKDQFVVYGAQEFYSLS